MRDTVRGRGTVAAALVLLLAASTILALPGARADLSLPSLVTGSRWSYAYTQSGNPTTPANGTYVLEETGLANVTVGSSTYLSYHLKIFFNATVHFGNSTGVILVTGDAYYRVSDLAIVQQTLRFTLSGTVLTSTMSDDPPLSIHWPLVPGANWTSSTLRTTVSSSGGSQTTTTSSASVDYRVAATESRTVPAGAFATTPLNGTDANGSYTQQYWSPSVGFWVEQELVSNGSYERFLLVSYRIGPANTPPAAGFVWSPATGDTTTLFTFTSTSSDAQDPASALQVRWDWNGDGVWDTGWSADPNATHTFPAAGVYNVTLEVMDTGGLTSQRTEPLTVTAANPLLIPVLGVPSYLWLTLVAAIAAAAVGVLVLRRRGARVPPPSPPNAPPPAP